MDNLFPAGTLICGVDEVGRGSAVGDIFAAACILPHEHGLVLRDSKKLTIRKREELFDQIQSIADSWAIGRVTCAEIALMNVHRASLLAMKRAVQSLSKEPEGIIVDGKFTLPMHIPCCSLVRADDTVSAVSAASILAKVARDAYMDDLHRCYPDYGFDKNRGYLTVFHKESLRRLGPCPEHRLHYRPVREVVAARTKRDDPDLFTQP
jgi:ribonuclease HII